MQDRRVCSRSLPTVVEPASTQAKAGLLWSFTKDQRDTIGYLEDFVYTWWDGSAAGFGASLMQKFPTDSLEYSELQGLVQRVKELYSNTVVGDVRSNGPTPPPAAVRAVGKPDFSIDGGRN